MSLKKDLKTSDSMRNKPCACGSGVKFKRCCWAQYNTSQRLTRLAWKCYMKDLRYISMCHFKRTGEFLTKDKLKQIIHMGNENGRPGKAEAMGVTT